MIKLVLYNTSSANNTINKVLTDATEYEIEIKRPDNINHIAILLHSDDFIDFNYAYIDRFKRYYFIEKIEIRQNKMYELYLRCDVLETFKDEILQCEGYIFQQENINPYYDSGYKSEERKEIDVYKSDVSLTGETSTILVTIGG